MPDNESNQSYLTIAEQFYRGNITEKEVISSVVNLFHFSLDELTNLATLAEDASRINPGWSWAIATVADIAALQTDDTWLQALAAFHLARTANEWVRPDRVAEAAARARAGFTALNQPGWAAACDWQLYALPWTRNDFQQAVEKLQAALAELHAAGMAEWVPHCQLSLAYAHILRGEYEQARHLITASEQVFGEKNEPLSRARCWLYEASCLRRQGYFDDVLSRLQKAFDTFSGLKAQVDITKTHYHFAYYYLFRGNYPQAENHFLLAIEGFSEYDIPLWLGQCYNGVGQVFNNMGRPVQALEAFQQADEYYASFDVRGLRADNLLDRARLEMLRADYSKSLESLQQAEYDYRCLGAIPIAATAALYQGEACLHMSRFQTGLHHLERAHTELQHVDSPWRLAECELYLAQAWTELGNPEIARSVLIRAIDHFRLEQQTAYLAQALNQLGLLLIQQGQFTEALPLFEEVLQMAPPKHIHIQTAAAWQYLGETYTGLGQYEQAIDNLEKASSFLEEAFLLADQIHCQVSIGNAYAKAGQQAKARTAWERAITLSKGTIPGIAWQAQVGLAELAIMENDTHSALHWIRQSVTSLVLLRQGFWQPALAGPFLQRAAPVLDRAISIVANDGAGADLLNFIEESKAHTLTRHLATDPFYETPDAPELADLKTEINALLRELRAFSDEPLLIQRVKRKSLFDQLRLKHREYELLQSRLERQTQRQYAPGTRFEMTQFRDLFGAQVGRNWVALDYYLTDTHLYGILLTSDVCRPWQVAITQQQKIALKLGGRPQGENDLLIPSDLEILGKLLFPSGLDKLLTPNTLLVITPHRRLHKIPWAAIPFLSGNRSQPLVITCVPLVVPALHTLPILSSRKVREARDGLSGLALAVSDFGERYRPLPFVSRELEQINGLFVNGGLQVLRDKDATWESLYNFTRKSPLYSLDFLHVATHAFSDPLTGRTSGIALFDQDLWLDQLWEIAPLPPLVTLSACYGLQSRVYEGDEHIGLATTCLAAGANHVVGSLWPVLDETAADLMVTFYRHYLDGKGIAHSLAEAQRAAIAISQPGWQSFSCYGLP